MDKEQPEELYLVHSQSLNEAYGERGMLLSKRLITYVYPLLWDDICTGKLLAHFIPLFTY
jgi:hypothetical protein